MDLSQEQQWVTASQGGDRTAFAKLVDLYWDKIRRWLYGLSGNHHVAEDLTQDVFLKAWSGLPRLQAEANFRNWLFRIAQNCFLDNRRRNRNSPAAALPEMTPARDRSPLSALVEQEANRTVQDALAKLPSHYRAAYLLWTQEDLPYSEIAQILSLTEQTARWRVHKARQLLLAKLKKFLDLSPS